jgi:thymidylate kinase
MTVHPTLAGLFADWNEQGVEWCLLRGAAALDAPRGDLDLLVAPADLTCARASAERRGFVPVPGRRHGTHLLQYDRAAACWLWLHIVTDLAFGPYRGLETGAGAECLARRRRDGVVARLAAEDEFWVLLLHTLLDRRAIASRHRDRLGVLARELPLRLGGGRLAAALQSVAPPEWVAERVVAAVRASSWHALEALTPGLAAAAARRARVSVLTRVARRIGRATAALRDLRRRRGVSVALLGPDGAGKSTLAAGLVASSVFPVRQVYMGLTGGMLRRVDKLRIPGIVRIGRLFVLWGRYLRAQYFQGRGAMVIFDRYIYDAEVPTPHPLSRSGRLARWIDGRSCPPPDLVIVLDAPGAVMYRRKGEYTSEMLEEWRQHFLAVRRRAPRVEVVDATRPPEVVRAEVLEHIWRRYAARWTGA